MTTPEPTEDFIILRVPPGATLDYERMRMMAEYQMLKQYEKPPRALVIEPIEWLVTNDWRDVEKFQPNHQCPTCTAANDQAIAFLKEYPDERLALGNLRYTEFW